MPHKNQRAAGEPCVGGWKPLKCLKNPWIVTSAATTAALGSAKGFNVTVRESVEGLRWSFEGPQRSLRRQPIELEELTVAVAPAACFR